MRQTFTESACRFGVRSVWAIVGLTTIYLVVLTVGLLNLPSPDVPIRGLF